MLVDHFETLTNVHEECYEPTHGPLRPVLAEAWRRAVLARFVRRGWLEADAAAAMPSWRHSGFSAYVGPAIAATDRAAVLRVARYGARAPVAKSRLRYDAERAEVELKSDASEGSYAGVHQFAALEFMARRVDHIPGQGRGAGAGLRAVREPAAAGREGRLAGRERNVHPSSRYEMALGFFLSPSQ